MLQTVAIRGYRSLRDVVLPLRRLTVVTGANGTGKSSLYRALRLLADCGRGEVIGSLAREGGLESALWAGPEQLGGARRTGTAQGSPRTRSVSIELGFASDDFGYLIDLGLPQMPGRRSFARDPEIKRETGVRRTGGPAGRHAGAPGTRPRRGRRRRRPRIRRTRPQPAAAPQRAGRLRRARHPNWSWCGNACATGGSTTASGSTAPLRRGRPQVGTRTPVLADDGCDLAAAVQTIVEAGTDDLARAVADAFDGASVSVSVTDGLFDLQLHQRGMLRPLRTAEIIRRHTAFPAVGRGAAEPPAAVADGAQRAGDVAAPRPRPSAGDADPTRPRGGPRSWWSRIHRRCASASARHRWAATRTPGRSSSTRIWGETKVVDQDLLTTPPWDWGKR